MMDIRAKADLLDHLQEWLNDEKIADILGGTHGIWQDTTTTQRNANILADACEVVIDAMALQSDLEKELNEE